MISALSTLLPWLAGTLGLAGLLAMVWDLFLRDSSRINQRVDDEFRERQRERARASSLFKNMGQRVLEAPASEPAETAVQDAAETDLWPRFELLVRQSGLNVSPSR